MAGETMATLAALRHLQSEGGRSARDMATAMSAAGERAVKLELSRSSHARGTKTPSKPYVNPPSLISGELRQSVRRTRLYQSGGWQWTAHVAPTTVYARIQELGGVTGRGHRTHLPPRPYVRPARNRAAPAARSAAIKVFRSATGL